MRFQKKVNQNKIETVPYMPHWLGFDCIRCSSLKEILIKNEDTSSACWSIRKVELKPPEYQAYLDELMRKMNLMVDGKDEEDHDVSYEDEFQDSDMM